MGGSTNKKVQIWRWEREPLSGFVNSQSYATSQGLELLTQTGTASVIPLADIKAVHFVREFQPGSPTLARKTFLSRPRLEGLWVRLRFRDQDVLEAILPNDLLQVEPLGFTILPPEVGGNTQRLFVPRTALLEVTVLGVVGSPLRRRKREAKEQIGLFE